MPTIDIPDKICSHCGGIRWVIEKEKRPYYIRTRYRCATKEKERHDLWVKKNLDKIKSYSRKKQQRPEGYYKTSKMKEHYRLKAKRESETLHDNFIKNKIMKSVEGISRSDIPQKLIDITRKHLLLIRQLNNQKNEKAKQERQKI